MSGDILIPILILGFMVAPARFESLLYGMKRREKFLDALKESHPEINPQVQDYGFRSIRHFIRCAIGKSARGSIIYFDDKKTYGASVHLIKGVGTAAVYFVDYPAECSFFLLGKSLSDLFSRKKRPALLSNPDVMKILSDVAELSYFRYVSFETADTCNSLLHGRLNPRNRPGIYLVFHPLPGSPFWGEQLLKAEHVREMVPLLMQLKETV